MHCFYPTLCNIAELLHGSSHSRDVAYFGCEVSPC